MWTAKLKRFETWDRVFVLLKAASWLYALVLIVLYLAGGELAKASATRPAESDGLGPFMVVFMLWFMGYWLFAEGFSLWVIWRHRRSGFVIQLVLASLSVFGAVSLQFLRPSEKPDSFWGWVPVGITAAYCAIRAYQLRPGLAPPPLPEN